VGHLVHLNRRLLNFHFKDITRRSSGRVHMVGRIFACTLQHDEGFSSTQPDSTLWARSDVLSTTQFPLTFMQQRGALFRPFNA
jgi:hypothetical protein